MQLLKARLNGVGNLLRSDWFGLAPGVNLIHIPNSKLRETFLRQLATINPFPLFSCEEAFGDVPATVCERGYSRRLNPSKRTAALAVFAAEPHLIEELGQIESILDGVDCIEVGRRLDGSRWLNFVEITSACRWWEIETAVAQLLEALGQLHPALGQLGVGITRGLEPSKRIKDNLEKELAGWLSRVLEESLPLALQDLAERVFHDVTRPSRVAVAKRLVEERLPMFIDLTTLAKLTEATEANSSRSRINLRERIVLIDGDQAVRAANSPEDFGKRLKKLAKDSQVISAFGDFDILSASQQTLKRFTVPGLRLASE